MSVPATSNAVVNCSVWEGNEVYYSTFCYHSSYLFLCSGLRNASYCILNRQYTKEEYELLVPKIIEKMIQDKEW